MRKLTYLVVIAVVLYGGYWFAGSTGVERGLAAWFDQQRSTGWVAEYTALETRGFPNRFDTTITDLELADPATGLAWSAPSFKIYALSYRPGHIIADWPNSQTIATPNQRISVQSKEMRGSILFNETTNLNLNNMNLVLDGMDFSSTAGWTSAMQHGQLAMRQVEGDAHEYDIYFEAKGITPASDFLKNLDNIEFLTGLIEGLSIDATLSFDADWNRFAVETGRPQITHIDLKLLQADWGQLDLRLAGALEVDARGVPTGQITVKAKNWREMMALAHQTGLLPAAMLPSVEKTLAFLASLSGDKETLDTPLTFKNGYIAFGPIPIGPAPNLTIR